MVGEAKGEGGRWYCNAVAGENSVTKWQRSWAIDRIRVRPEKQERNDTHTHTHTGAKQKQSLGRMGSCTKGKWAEEKGFDEIFFSFLKGSIGFCFKRIKWRQQIQKKWKEERKKCSSCTCRFGLPSRPQRPEGSLTDGA